MMKIFAVINLVIGMLWLFAGMAGHWSLLEWINTTFLVGISALMLVVISRIWHTGSIDRFLEGFRLLGRMITPKTRSQEWADQQIAADEKLIGQKEAMGTWLKRILFSLASISLLISLAGLCLYQF